jgi:hypothetical protein
MANEVFNIEFKFPTGHASEWGMFAAKARQSATDAWEIYSVLSYSQAAVPFQNMILIKEMNEWRDSESNQETLLAALVGRAIDKATKRT